MKYPTEEFIDHMEKLNDLYERGRFNEFRKVYKEFNIEGELREKPASRVSDSRCTVCTLSPSECDCELNTDFHFTHKDNLKKGGKITVDGFIPTCCTRCKKSVNNSNKLEYAFYPWEDLPNEIACRNCIQEDKEKDAKGTWKKFEQLWNNELSMIEKSWYVDLANIKENKFFDERYYKKEYFATLWHELDLVHQYCLLRIYETTAYKPYVEEEREK